MTQVKAVYEAEEGLFRLEHKLDLSNHAEVTLTVEPAPMEMSVARRIGGDIVADPDLVRQIVENEDLLGCD